MKLLLFMDVLLDINALYMHAFDRWEENVVGSTHFFTSSSLTSRDRRA